MCANQRNTIENLQTICMGFFVFFLNQPSTTAFVRCSFPKPLIDLLCIVHYTNVSADSLHVDKTVCSYFMLSTGSILI